MPERRHAPGAAATLGVVVIGRNEGDRLRRCVASVLPATAAVVYVDSGSDDGSPGWVAAQGVQVLNLDLSRPFTAARARNVGWRALVAHHPGLQHVAFVDGDCEVEAGWLAAAESFLQDHPQVVAVCGRRRERRPEASVYNRLCDLEWDTPVGPARAVGGDAVFRLASLQAAGGYRDDLIAGEEPELCVRLRARGGEVWRLDMPMTLHDAAMHRFGQWWTRSVRAGHAFAEGAWLHGAAPERHFVAETRRALLWGLILPMLCLMSAAWVSPWGLLGGLIYPLQWLRLGWRARRRPWGWTQSGFLVLGKFAEAQGVLKFAARAWSGRPRRLIEYK